MNFTPFFLVGFAAALGALLGGTTGCLLGLVLVIGFLLVVEFAGGLRIGRR